MAAKGCASLFLFHYFLTGLIGLRVLDTAFYLCN